MKLLSILLSAVLLAACGGGDETPVAIIKTSTPHPVANAATVTGASAVAIHMYQALYGMAPSNPMLTAYTSQATADATAFAQAMADNFANTSHADLAKVVLDNFGVTAVSVPAVNAKGESEYALLLDAVKQMFSTYPSMRGQVILNMANLLAELENDATYGTAAATYNVQSSANFLYSSGAFNGIPVVLTLPPAPKVTLSSSSATVYKGDSATVTWTTTNATSCTASGDWSGSLPTAGSQSVKALTLGSLRISISCTNSILTSNTTIAVAVTEKPYFMAVSNGLSVQSPFVNSVLMHLVPADINGDGLVDLVAFYWAPTYTGTTAFEPTPNTVRIFVNKGDKFVDETSSYISGSTDIQGAARKVEVYDINRDGKPDFLLAVNNEDGRIVKGVGNANINERKAMLLSGPDGYKVVIVGSYNWYHSIGVGFHKNNVPYLIGQGYSIDIQEAYTVAGYAASLFDIPLPPVSPNTFQLMSQNGGTGESIYLLQRSNDQSSSTLHDGFQKDVNTNIWDRVSPLTIATKVGSIDILNADGTYESTSGVYWRDGKYFAQFDQSESCQMRKSPTDPLIAVFQYDGWVIPIHPVQTQIKRTDLILYPMLIGTRIVNRQVVEENLGLDKENHANPGYISCKDINGDGYDDIVINANTILGAPFVYLNNKAGGFNFVDQTVFPNVTYGWGVYNSDRTGAIYSDFNNDGIPDLLMYPLGAIYQYKIGDPIEYRYLIGLRNIQ